MSEHVEPRTTFDHTLTGGPTFANKASRRRTRFRMII
jgi:hypothetical protein